MFNIKLVFCLFLLVNCLNVEAYINPGTGGDFLQMVLGVLSSIVALVKKIFRALWIKKESDHYE